MFHNEITKACGDILERLSELAEEDRLVEGDYLAMADQLARVVKLSGMMSREDPIISRVEQYALMWPPMRPARWIDPEPMPASAPAPAPAPEPEPEPEPALAPEPSSALAPAFDSLSPPSEELLRLRLRARLWSAVEIRARSRRGN
jgi:hypothetical protein